MLAGLTFPPLGDARAEDRIAGGSLALAPHDADFYVGIYSGDKQWKALLEGPVLTSLLELPVVQENWAVFLKEWDKPQGNLAVARFAVDSPVLQDILKFSCDLVSKDLFIWGNGGISRWGNLSTELAEKFSTNLKGEELEEELALELLDRIGAEFDQGPLPTVLMGGKFESEYDAVSKVDQLELLLGFGTQRSPEVTQILKRIKRVDDDRGSRLVVECNGGMIPWDALSASESFTPAIKEKLQSIIQDQTVAMVLGMLDGYFIFAIAPTAESVMDWNSGPHLDTHRDVLPALQHPDRELLQVVYVSDALGKANFDSNFKNIISKNVSLLTNALQTSGDLNDNQLLFVDEIRKEGDRLNADLMKLFPEIRGSLAYGWLTDDGMESYTHVRTENALLDGSRSLDLLQRLGTDPMVAMVTNHQKRPDIAAFVVDCASSARRLLLRANELNVAEEDREDLERAVEVVEFVWPTLEKLASICSNQLVPALDGEGGLSITSGNILSQQWIEQMPESSVALPIYEAGVIWKLNDVQQFRGAVDEIRTVINEFLEQIRQKYPEELPAEIQLPKPVEVESELGTKLVYALPESIQSEGIKLPAGVVPQAIYTDDALVLSYSDAHANALAKKSDFQMGHGQVDQNAAYANVGYVDFGKLLGVLRPWVHYAAETNATLNGVDLDANQIDTRESIGVDFTLTINDLLSVWDVLQKTGSLTNTIRMEENGGTVSRTVYTQSR